MKTGGRTATLRQSLSISRAVLRDGGIAEWSVEAETLLRHVLETNRADFLTLVYAKDGILNHSQAKYLSSLLDLRLSGEPLAYIVGRREFYGLELEVNEHVLIPRQETELLVDIVLEYLPSFEPTPRVVDVGTGSGAVALAIAANSKSVDIIATDNSGGALDVVRRNASKLGLSNRISFVRCDMLDAVGGPVDIIVSNPPYIPSGQIEYLQTEVQTRAGGRARWRGRRPGTLPAPAGAGRGQARSWRSRGRGADAGADGGRDGDRASDDAEPVSGADSRGPHGQRAGPGLGDLRGQYAQPPVSRRPMAQKVLQNRSSFQGSPSMW